MVIGVANTNTIYIDLFVKLNDKIKIGENMGFIDIIKKGANLAKQGLDKMDEQIKKQTSKKSDFELQNMDSSNKYVREELQKRGL